MRSLRDLARFIIEQKVVDRCKRFRWQLFDAIRIDEHFSDKNRGREYKEGDSYTSNFGITDNKHTPDWAKAYFEKIPILAGKDQFTFNASSPVVSFFKQHNIPVIGGASGTLTFVLRGITLMHEINLSLEQMREYVALLTAAMIAEGHHSVAEVMMVACTFNLYPYRTSTGEVAPYKFPFDQPERHYDIFLPDSFKKTYAYKELLQKYPQFLKPENASSKPANPSMVKSA